MKKVPPLFSLAVAAGITGQATANPAGSAFPMPMPATKPAKAVANPNQTLADDVAYRLRSAGETPPVPMVPSPRARRDRHPRRRPAKDQPGQKASGSSRTRRA